MSQVSNKFLKQMAAHTYKGNNTGSIANPIDVTNTQLTADLNLFTSSLQGLTPLSGGGTTNFLRADGTWAAPTGTGTVSTVSVVTANGFAGTVSNATTTPAITLTTSITGILSGNGTSISAAANGSIATTLIGGTSTQIMYIDPTGFMGGDAAFTFNDTTKALTLGVNATTAGTLLLANGGTSGTSITIQNLGNTTAYNFNLPTTAGTAGQVLTSQAGGSTSMTWATVALNGFIYQSTGSVYGGTNSTLTFTGVDNTVVGQTAGNVLAAGAHNTLYGFAAGLAITSGADNVLIGYQAGSTDLNSLNKAVIVGSSSNDNGATDGSVGIGYGVTTNGASVVIGMSATASTGNGGVSIGKSAAHSGGGIAIGNTASTLGGDLALGYKASAAASGSIALGQFMSVASHTYSLAVGNNANNNVLYDPTSANNQISFGVPGAPMSDMFLGNGAKAAASPVAITMQPTPASGANIAGSNFTLLAGNGTGTGGSGSILFKTAPVAGSSSTANTYATALTLTNTQAANFANAITAGTNGTTAGTLSLATSTSAGASVTLQNTSALTAYNFNLPVTAGTTGQILTSAGGGSSAMTWTSPYFSAAGNYWSGYTGRVASWLTASGTFADGTNTGGNAITTRVSNGITVTAGSSNVAGITFTPASSTAVYYITALFQGGAGAQSQGAAFQLTDGTNVIAQTGMAATVNGLGLEGSLSGVYAPNTGGAVTIKIQMANASGSNCGINTATGGGSIAASSIEWSIIQLPSASSGGSAPPTVQKFLSGSGTYTTPANVLYIVVRAVGGGAGGTGGGSGSPTVGGAGGNTTFGSSLISANGAPAQANITIGGAGGTASLGTGPLGRIVLSGSSGTAGSSNTGALDAGGPGGSSPFGGSGGGGNTTGGGASNGFAAIVNSGSGGGGGSSETAAGFSGGGGGSGGFVDAIIVSPSATYSYSIGTAGTAGGAGTLGAAGGAGGSGYIEVTEYYPVGTSGVIATANGGTGLSAPGTSGNILTSNGTIWTSAAPVSVTARYTGTTSSISSTPAVVVYSTQDFDSNSAYSTSTGLYTVPVAGKYHVTAMINTAWNSATPNSSSESLYIYKNGTATTRYFQYMQNSGGAQDMLLVVDTISCAVNDTIAIYASSSATSPTIGNDPTRDIITITRVGS